MPALRQLQRYTTNTLINTHDPLFQPAVWPTEYLSLSDIRDPEVLHLYSKKEYIYIEV